MAGALPFGRKILELQRLDRASFLYRIPCIACRGVVGQNPYMSVLSLPPLRDFKAVRQEIDQVVFRLANTHDPTARVELLRTLRLLLHEADQIVASL